MHSAPPRMPGSVPVEFICRGRQNIRGCPCGSMLSLKKETRAAHAAEKIRSTCAGPSLTP
jgi:hypothetical protein